MPRLVFRTTRHLYEKVLKPKLRFEAEEIVTRVILWAFPTLEEDERHVESRWQIDESARHTSCLDVDVVYSVGEHGFGLTTTEPGFTETLQLSIVHKLGERFFADGTLSSVGAWPMPQMNACWGRLTRAGWQRIQRVK